MSGPSFALRALVVAAAVLVAGCRDDTVRVGFRPDRGDRFAYRIAVHAATVAQLEGEPPRRSVVETVFDARHAVVDTGPSGTTVEVRLRERGGRLLTFSVRLDRSGQLTEVRHIEGLPADALGELGLSEIFPAAVAGPPDRPLAPGARWSLDETVQIGGPPPVRLTGRGRLAELGVLDGRRVARVENDYRLPVRRRGGEGGRRLDLDGWQDTRARAAYAVDDGAVVWAEAHTTGTYRLTVLPPEGSTVAPVPATLAVEVRSTTRRRG